MVVFNNILAGASGAAGADAGYEISRSLRFNSGDSSYISRTPSSAGNRKTWTWSGWVKRSNPGTNEVFFSAGDDSSDDRTYRLRCYFVADEIKLSFGGGNGSCSATFTGPVYRDPSAWFHLVISVDTNESSISDAFKVYINGVQSVSATSGGNVSYSTFDTPVNNNVAHEIGRRGNGSEYFNGYLADVQLIDGQALAATDFGEYDDNNVWQAKDYSGTYGTNGFHLDFSDNSSNAALGTDSSGNSNDWTVNNLSIGGVPYSSYGSGTVASTRDYANAFDGSTSTFCEPNDDQTITFDFTSLSGGGISVSSSLRMYLNKAGTPAAGHFTVNGTNLGGSIPSSNWLTISGVSLLETITFFHDSGSSSVELYAVEVDGTILVDGSAAGNDSLIDTPTNYDADSGNNGGNYATMNPLDKDANCTLSNGNLDVSCSTSGWFGANATMQVIEGKTYFEATYVSGSYINIGLNTPNTGVGDVNTDGVHLQNDNGTWRVRNGSSTASISAVSANSVIGVAVDTSANTIQFFVNGSSVYSGTLNALHRVPLVYGYGTYSVKVNFGQRPFAYTPPTGFKSLCTQNMPDPTIADGSTAMDVALYTGNGTSQTISGLGFSPDWVWTKLRSAGFGHRVWDTVRGATKRLEPNAASAETTESTALTAFTSDGFSVGSEANVNTTYLGGSFVAWCWDAGSSTVSNTDGSITSNVRANPSAGFSIVTGSGNSGTVGHGLNAKPDLVIVKQRNNAVGWAVAHSGLGTGVMKDNIIYLNGSSANTTSSNFWGTSNFDSSVFPISSNICTSGATFVAYCFAPVEGYSAFGSYTGNGSTNGPFVYTGMRPAWLLVKKTNAAESWILHDTSRSPYNVSSNKLSPNSSNAESSSTFCDFLSNGFRLKTSTGGEGNDSGSTYIYAAFASHPFKTARAR